MVRHMWAAIQRALTFRATGELTGDHAAIPTPTTNERTIRRRAEMMLAVDDGIGRLMDKLEELGTLDETMIVFTSDNGFFYEEHGLTSERRLPYEESIRNPLIIRYPPVAAPGSQPTGLAVTVDIAPTVLDAAGAPIGDHIQGRSLLPVLRGDMEGWRDAALIEFYTYENPFRHLMDMDYRAVRTERYKYIHWMKFPDMDELYDLEADPYEMDNVVDEPAMASVRSELRAELGRLSLHAMGLGDPDE